MSVANFSCFCQRGATMIHGCGAKFFWCFDCALFIMHGEEIWQPTKKQCDHAYALHLWFVEALKNDRFVLLEEFSFGKDYISGCTVGGFYNKKHVEWNKHPYAHTSQQMWKRYFEMPTAHKKFLQILLVHIHPCLQTHTCQHRHSSPPIRAWFLMIYWSSWSTSWKNDSNPWKQLNNS